MANRYEEHMYNVKVDLWTHELLRFIKDAKGAETMKDVIREALLPELTDEQHAEITRRADKRLEYMDMRKGDK